MLMTKKGVIYMTLVKKLVIYKDKNNQEKQCYNFYIVTENGTYVSIKPTFANDYNILKVIAKVY